MEEFSKDFSPLNRPEKPSDYSENFDDADRPEAEKATVKEIKPALIVGVLAILTLTGLFFTVSNWFDSLKIPFARNSSLATASANANDQLDLTNTDVANLLELKQKDTDQDGLTDYDELYLYKTSPYIPDSDSDGYSDGEEVTNSQDPNCPAGVSCASLTLPGDQANLALPDNVANLTPDQIRALLLQAGVGEAELNNLDDNALLELYQQVARENAGQSVIEDDGLGGLKPDEFEAITPEQLRMMLMEQGISKTDLDNVSDDDLRALWQEILNNSTTSQ